MSSPETTPAGSRDDDPRLPTPDAESGAEQVTPEQEAEIESRERRYLWVMIPCIVLLVIGFFAPLPTPVRVGVLALAAGMPLVGVLVGNTSRTTK